LRFITSEKVGIYFSDPILAGQGAGSTFFSGPAEFFSNSGLYEMQRSRGAMRPWPMTSG
jgi:hypothetical protein